MDENGRHPRLHVLAVTPARLRSERIPRKNLSSIGGVPLLKRVQRAAHESKYVTSHVIHTDSAEVFNFALDCDYGPGQIIYEPGHPILHGPKSSTWLILRDAVQRWPLFDVAVNLIPTSPFRTGEQIDKTIDLLLESGADHALTYSVDELPAWWGLYRNRETGYLDYFGEVALADDPEWQENALWGDYPESLHCNGLVWAARVKDILGGLEQNKGTHVGWETEHWRALDLDRPYQVEIAEFYAATKEGNGGTQEGSPDEGLRPGRGEGNRAGRVPTAG